MTTQIIYCTGSFLENIRYSRDIQRGPSLNPNINPYTLVPLPTTSTRRSRPIPPRSASSSSPSPPIPRDLISETLAPGAAIRPLYRPRGAPPTPVSPYSAQSRSIRNRKRLRPVGGRAVSELFFLSFFWVEKSIASIWF
jgi:hypothetical protein